MLAYIFWHAATASADLREYAKRLHAFHQKLMETPPDGLLASHTWQTEAVSWLNAPHVFEDWYVMADTSHLDALAKGAVSHHVGADHDAVARLAAEGTAALYKPARRVRAEVDGLHATWFSKPAGMSYDELYARLDQQDPSNADRLWQRFLTLGPSPEFCLVGTKLLELDGSVPAVVRRWI